MSWPITWPAGADATSTDPLQRALAEQYAARTLRMLTLGRVGGAPVTVTPTATAYDRLDALLLPPPIGEIVSVTILGLALLPSEYYVEGGALLVRADGAAWPTAGVVVTYVNGYPVSEVGKHAGGVLAHEYLKMLTGGKNCRLPSTVTSLQRQGISMELTLGMFPEGLTKIPEVDHYIHQWNPHGLKSAPTVTTPDAPEARVISWRAP